ncbi:MAG: hypothetical protein QM790_13150 [Nibricoccus sp.]
MLTGVLITGGLHLAREKALTPEDVFWKAVTETRRTALLSGREVRLSYSGKDKRDRALVARMLDGTEQRFSFEGTAGDKFEFEFLPAKKGGSAILVLGQLVETQLLQYVTFYGDGTCSPFRVQIRLGGEPRVFAIDPWTCSLVLPKTSEKP